MDHEVDHQRENLISRIIMVHLVLDVSESGKAALLSLGSESLGCREVGDLVRLRMPQTEGLVPLRRVVQNSLTSFNHANRKDKALAAAEWSILYGPKWELVGCPKGSTSVASLRPSEHKTAVAASHEASARKRGNRSTNPTRRSTRDAARVRPPSNAQKEIVANPDATARTRQSTP